MLGQGSTSELNPQPELFLKLRKSPTVLLYHGIYIFFPQKGRVQAVIILGKCLFWTESFKT